jgi:homoserine dehydrogenase
MSEHFLPLNVALLGMGTVGSGTVKVIQNLVKQGFDGAQKPKIQITHIADLQTDKVTQLCQELQLDHLPTITNDAFAVVNHVDVDVVVELIGGDRIAKELVIAALKAKKHVVTANKALLAKHGVELFALAQENGVHIAFEASVAGGIPVIKALREGLSANEIQRITGIINGTSNFILTEMKEKQLAFKTVLAQAQALGYAEADPTFDIEGVDAAHKLSLLSALAFNTVPQFTQAYNEGITQITTADMQYAQELGYEIKLLGITQKNQNNTAIELRVHPSLVAKTNLISQVNGVMNAVQIKGDAVGETMYYGAGAGSLPTASAVVADIIDIALGRTTPLIFAPTDQQLPIASIDERFGAYYLRMNVENTSGVLSKITNVLAQENISIDVFIQKNNEDPSMDTIICITEACVEKSMQKALISLNQLPFMKESVQRIRVEK